jgi:DMSO reductase family type II enzyme heme b subunit
LKQALAILCGIVCACGIARAQNLGTDTQREAGKKVYDHKCAQCHGDNGDGNGDAKQFFRPTPRDFTYGLFKIRTTPSGALPSDDDLKKVIRDGMPYTGMPAWPELSDDELTNLVYYIKTFAPVFADADAVTAPVGMPKAPGFSEESAQAGRKIYEDNKCADCHGNTGRGDGKSSPTLKNDWSESIRPADLTHRWTFRGGSRREDIYRTFTTGLNGTPMPSYADLITEEDRWRLVDYVYSLSRDEPEYSTVVVAGSVETPLDIAQGRALFDTAAPAYFPVFGQIVEPERNFFPAATGVEVRAIYNATEVAVLVAWNDMTPDTSGTNRPMAPPADSAKTGQGETAAVYSDAVAVQWPSQNPAGSVKPYFLFGDAKNSVDLWFVDLSTGTGQSMVGRGSQAIETTTGAIAVNSSYKDGEWTVVFKRPRAAAEGALSFTDGFVPVAFSIWNGFDGETGNVRGVTSWYHLYLEPAAQESNVIPIAKYGALTLLAEVVLIAVVRRRNRPGDR